VVRGGKALSVNYTDSDSPIHAFRHAVKEAARQAMALAQLQLLTPPIHLGTKFVFGRPAYLNKKKLGTGEVPHDKKRADLDNLVKGLMDACTGILWEDDSQVQTLWVEKCFAAVGDSPHVVVVAEELPSILRKTHGQAQGETGERE
jgi:Holliday junction resolvase RusA-like endonuclease